MIKYYVNLNLEINGRKMTVELLVTGLGKERIILGFEWTDDCQKAFEELKKWFTEEPVLMMPDQSWPFQIETDASKYATGAVLTQLDLNGDRHPVSFISKIFSLAERNYEIYDWELLVIIRVLEKWRHYIQGSPHTTIILSDHKNLTYYHEAKKLNRWQAQCSLYLFGIWC